MNKLKLLLLPILLLTSVAVFYAYNPLTGMELLFPVLKSAPDTEPELPKDPIKHRIPSKSVMVSINPQNGVTIEGLESPILLYEIWGTDGNPVLIIDNEFEFVDFIMNLTGEYEVRFHTEAYVYIGYVEL